MVSPHTTLGRLAWVAVSTAVAVVLRLALPAGNVDTIRVWKVGSPHLGNTPETTVRPGLKHAAAARGIRISIEAFPAQGFAATFFEAVSQNAAPDVIAFDNFGVMTGITTHLGVFAGIGEEPSMREALVHITGAFDDLLGGPKRGWTFMFAHSASRDAVRQLALRTPDCPSDSRGPERQDELGAIVPAVATAYLNGNTVDLQAHADPDRLPAGSSNREPARVVELRTCGVWGNHKLAFASVHASYEADTSLGHMPVLLAFRKPADRWQLLVTARDPISTGEFVTSIGVLPSLLTGDGQVSTLPTPATLESPPQGMFPRPPANQRFGNFAWWPSQSRQVVAELVEFAYKDDARLFLRWPGRAQTREQLSSGRLWSTAGAWQWRVWSISSVGDVVFSEARLFRH